MVSFSDFFRPTSLRQAIARYLAVSVLRYLWAVITGSASSPWEYLHPFDINARAILNALPAVIYYLPLGGLVTFAFWLAQLVLLWRVVRLLMKEPDEVIAREARAGSWLTTPLMLSFIVIVTCSVIGWLFETGANPSNFVYYMIYASSVPVKVGLVLSLLGFAFGGRFVARAKASVGGLFGVNYLPADHPLSQRVARHATTLGIATPPAVGIVNVMNAFAIGTPKDSAVILGQPLMDTLTDEELDAVIGHELGHIYHNDMNRMQFAEGFQRMLGSVISATTVIIVSALSRNRSDIMLGRMAGGALRQTVFFGSELVVKGISRSREFQADAIGARIASPAAMIGALERIHGIPAQPTRLEAQYGYLMFRGSRFGAWFSTHPLLERRVKALRSLETQGTDASSPQSSEAAISTKPELEAMTSTAAAALGTAYGTARRGLADVSSSLALSDRAQTSWAAAGRLAQKIPTRRLSLRSTATIVVLGILAVLVAPAIYDYYRLDEKTASMQASVADGYSWATTMVAGTSDSVIAAVTSLDEQLLEKESQLQTRQTQIDVLSRDLADVKRDVLNLKADNDELRTEVIRVSTENLRLAESRSSPALTSPSTEKLLRDRNVELTSQVEQQKLTIASMQEEMQRLRNGTPSSGSSISTQAGRGDLERLIEEQNATITALRQDIETFRFKVAQQEKLLSGASPESTNEIVPLGTWLAAAVDRQGAVDTATFQNDRETAQRLALEKCGGASQGCKIIGAYENACFALSRPASQKVRQNWWYAADSSWQEAERRAIYECRQGSGAQRCDIRISVCSPSSLSKP